MCVRLFQMLIALVILLQSRSFPETCQWNLCFEARTTGLSVWFSHIVTLLFSVCSVHSTCLLFLLFYFFCPFWSGNVSCVAPPEVSPGYIIFFLIQIEHPRIGRGVMRRADCEASGGKCVFSVILGWINKSDLMTENRRSDVTVKAAPARQ